MCGKGLLGHFQACDDGASVLRLLGDLPTLDNRTRANYAGAAKRQRVYTDPIFGNSTRERGGFQQKGASDDLSLSLSRARTNKGLVALQRHTLDRLDLEKETWKRPVRVTHVNRCESLGRRRPRTKRARPFGRRRDLYAGF